MIDLKTYKFDELPKGKAAFKGDFVEIRALTTRELMALTKLKGETEEEDEIKQAIFCLIHGCDIDEETAEKLVDNDLQSALTIVNEIVALSNDFHNAVDDISQKKM